MQAQTSPASQRAVIELRYFRMRNGRQVERTTEYLRRGLLPASERAGIRPVGCFNAVFAPDSPFIMTLASYPSLPPSRPLARSSPPTRSFWRGPTNIIP